MRVLVLRSFLRCLCVQVLSRVGQCGCVWYLKCRLSIVNFVFVVHVGGSVVRRGIALLGLCL